MNDMGATIVPKSDQLNADDLIAGPRTIQITGVTITQGEQPVSIHFEGDNGKPYKACKSMCRVMVNAWGADSKKYAGRSMTLFREPTVKWGGMEVGGIRISHMSHIDSKLTMALTMTRANKKPYTVTPLVTRKESAPPPEAAGNSEPPALSPLSGQASAVGADPHTIGLADDLLLIGATEAGKGIAAYEAWWTRLAAPARKAVGAEKHSQFKLMAQEVNA
jgi:hypothetical protein